MHREDGTSRRNGREFTYLRKNLVFNLIAQECATFGYLLREKKRDFFERGRNKTHAGDGGRGWGTKTANELWKHEKSALPLGNIFRGLIRGAVH
jgi:hypothetical protein